VTVLKCFLPISTRAVFFPHKPSAMITGAPTTA